MEGHIKLKLAYREGGEGSASGTLEVINTLGGLCEELVLDDLYGHNLGYIC